MAFGVSPAGEFPPPVVGDFGGGAVAALVVRLIGEENGTNGGEQFDAWAGSVQLDSSDVSWDDLNGLTFETAGIYEVSMQGRAIAAGEEPVFPTTPTVYGSLVSGADQLEESRYASNDSTGGSYNFMSVDSLTWHDTFTFAATVGATCMPSLYCRSYGGGSVQLNFAAVLIVRRLGDAA